MSSVALQEFKECLKSRHFWRHLQFSDDAFSQTRKRRKLDFNDFTTCKTRCKTRTWKLLQFIFKKKSCWNDDSVTGFEQELTQTCRSLVPFPKSHLQARMQPGARDVQHTGGMQVSRLRHSFNLFVPLCLPYSSAVNWCKICSCLDGKPPPVRV